MHAIFTFPFQVTPCDVKDMCGVTTNDAWFTFLACFNDSHAIVAFEFQVAHCDVKDGYGITKNNAYQNDDDKKDRYMKIENHWFLPLWFVPQQNQKY